MTVLVVISCLSSFVVTLLLVRYSHLHVALTADSTDGPQKFHAYTVPRVGGIGIIVGVASAVVIVAVIASPQHPTFADQAAALLLCSVPAFVAGFLEDVTKRVGVGARLAATMLSAAIAYFMIDGVLDHVDVAGLDYLLRFGVVSLVFTMIAVGGTANAINIVDGYNGLAGVLSILTLLALGAVSYLVGDAFLSGMCLALAGAAAGFVFWNFPRGRIFLGDGGAYFIGFMIGEISVLLIRRHPEVSPWFPLMLMAYPVWETLFSIYRKKLVRGQSPGDADGLHFHQLVYKRVIRWKVGSKRPEDRLARNSLTSPFLWVFALTTTIPALLFWDSSVILGFCAFGFGFTYVWLYRRILGFHVPKWLILHRSREVSPDVGEFQPSDPNSGLGELK